MEKYKPGNTNTEKIDQINIISKHIVNPIYKPDKSYFVSDKYKCNQQDSCTETIIYDYDRLIHKQSGVHLDVSTDLLEGVTYKNIQIKIGKFEKEFRKLVNITGIKPKNVYLNFIISGIHGRSIIIGMVDCILNIMGFKGLLITPYFLYYCLGQGVQKCIVVDEYVDRTNVFIVDDYFIYNYFVIKKDSYKSGDTLVLLPDDEDYREEWQKCRLIKDIPYYTCTLCGFTHYREEWVCEHLRNIHLRTDDDLKPLVLKYFNEHGDVVEEIIKRIKVVYNQDRLNKQTTKVLYNDRIGNKGDTLDRLLGQLKFLYGNVSICKQGDTDKIVVEGSDLFNKLNISKECWMTNEEWHNGRFRVLKEKVLWFI